MAVVWVLLGLACAFLAGVYAVYHIAFRSAPDRSDGTCKLPAGEQYEKFSEIIPPLIESIRNRPYEPVEIVSRDGLRLVGRYYHQRDGAPLDIGMHGYRGTIERDFCGGSALSFDAGHNVLLIEQRAQNNSAGHAMTFGVKERFDCLDWIEYALDRFGEEIEIVLYGVSMGATTVLMAAGLGLPPQVRGVIADCPFSSPYAIIEKVAGDMHLPAWLARLIAPLAAKRFAGFDLFGASAAEAVRSAKVPILLIHGADDRFVPCEMSREIAAAAREGGADCTLHLFPNAGHGISYLEDTPRYRALVADFWDKILEHTESRGKMTE